MNAPLALVLCEVRFSPVLTMETRVPAIQDRLRGMGFPIFEQSTVHQLELSADEPKFTGTQRWLFGDKRREAFVVLTRSSLAFEVLNYSSFEDFMGSLVPVIDLVREIANPALHERLGLRYVNTLPEVGDNLDKYLKERILSFKPEDLGVSRILTSSQVLGRTDKGQVSLRLVQVEDGPVFPPDLMTPELQHLAKHRQGVHAVLDIDGADNETEDFISGPMESRLWAIHEYTQRAFWASVTDEAITEWGLTEEDVRGANE